ncbi:MAG: GspH/FimT family pseudopilin [Gammaproteobacteria bacterium]
MNTGRGFTLLELMVVLVIVGIVLAVVPVAFSGAVRSAELKAATHEMAAALKRARNHAVAAQRETVLLLEMANRRYRLGGSQKRRQLPAHIQLSLVTARSELVSDQSGAIRFFPDGSTTGGRISLKGDKRTYHVDIDWLTGKVSIRG